jgi:predicted  nucleic acid-binding Zn-ribbon protein
MTINLPNPSAKAQVIITSLITGEPISFFPYDFEFDDIFRPEWGTYDGFGRMDPIMTYKRTSRTATLSFNVVAEERNDDILSNTGRPTAENNFEKLQKLIQALYPTYASPRTSTSELLGQRERLINARARAENGFGGASVNGQVLGPQQIKLEQQKIEQQITNITEENQNIRDFGIGVIDRSPLFKINFMNLLNNDEYVIAVTNFKHKMKFDAADTSLDSNGKAIPGEFNINMTFTILHTYIPGEKLNYNNVYEP